MKKLLILSLFLLSPALASAAPVNSITITDKSGTASTNYPFQFGRPFVQGEIANYPQVVINGSPAPTQADVKNRYPDGSVEYAVISVMIPTIPANGSLTISFQNQSSGNNSPLTQAQMLDPAYNFDAKINITSGGVTKTASARTMLSSGNCTPWTSGQIAQSMLCADDSINRIYDMGFDSARSIRPRFYVTFWPATHQVTVRYVGENSNTQTLEDVPYDLNLTLGNSSPTTPYTKAGLIHFINTRWTKVFWIGGQPQQKINVDHNLAYLKETKFFPNYNTALSVPESTIAADYTYWQTKPKDLYDAGMWQKYMPTTGQTDSPEVGPDTRWATLWLLSGDWRYFEQTKVQADLAGAWGMFFREGDPVRKFDRAQTIPAIGRTISLNARPIAYLGFEDITDPRFATISDQPQVLQPLIVTPGYPTHSDGWTYDGAHQPDPFSAAYTLTGDYFYLEGAQMWAALDVLSYGPTPNFRGAAGYAGIYDQVRGNGWVLRNRVNAAFLSPDGTPEKEYFNQTVNDAIAKWEGERNITGTASQGPAELAEWNIGKSLNIYFSVFHFWTGYKNDYNGLGGMCPLTGAMAAEYADYISDQVCNITSLWHESFLTFELGRAKEMGFATGPLLTWDSAIWNGQFADPGYNPKLSGSSITPQAVYDPTEVADYYGLHGRPLTSWAEVASYESATNVNVLNVAFTQTAYPWPYFMTALDAVSMTAQESGGAVAWQWFQTNFVDRYVTYYSSNPSWAILPRTTNTTPLPPPTSTTVGLSATPSSLTSSGSATLTWTSTNRRA